MEEMPKPSTTRQTRSSRTSGWMSRADPGGGRDNRGRASAPDDLDVRARRGQRALAVALAALALRTVDSQGGDHPAPAEELEGFAGRVAHDSSTRSRRPRCRWRRPSAAPRATSRMAALSARGRRGSAGRALVEILGVRPVGRAPDPGRHAGAVGRRGGRRRRGDAHARGRARDDDRSRAPAGAARRPVRTRVLGSLVSNLVSNAVERMGSSSRRQVRVGISRSRTRAVRGRGHGTGAPARAVSQAFDRTCAEPAQPRRGSAWAGDRAPPRRGARWTLRRVDRARRGRDLLVRAAGRRRAAGPRDCAPPGARAASTPRIDRLAGDAES